MLQHPFAVGGDDQHVVSIGRFDLALGVEGVEVGRGRAGELLGLAFGYVAAAGSLDGLDYLVDGPSGRLYCAQTPQPVAAAVGAYPARPSPARLHALYTTMVTLVGV